MNLDMTKTDPRLRLPPQDLDAEKAVLGSAMLRPGALYEIGDVLAPEVFYADKHKIIYEAMQELHQKNEPIDLLSLSGRLKSKKQLEKVGGHSYLVELTHMVPSSANIQYYASVVYKKYILRGLIEAADHINNLAFEETTQEIEDLLDEAEKKLFSTTQKSGKGNKFISIKNTLDEVWEQIVKRQADGGVTHGVPTGFADLDNLLAGLHKSDLIILAARPSVGKTSLALDIARNAAVNHNIPVGIFSLEMSAAQLASRMLSAQSRILGWNIRTGHGLNDQVHQTLQEASALLSKAPIFIDDQAGASISRMRSVARRMKSEHGLGLIVVDYLQLMSTSKNYDSMVNQVTEISRSLKSLARELDVPVLALSQLSRAVEARGGKPRLSDLRDSGSIEQDADLVMFIHREDKYKEMADRNNIAEILVEKHRNGPVGRVELYFDDKTTSFMSLDKGTMDTFSIPEKVNFDEF